MSSNCVVLEADASSPKHCARAVMLAAAGGGHAPGGAEGAEWGGILGYHFYEVLVSNTIIYSAMEITTFSSRQSWLKGYIS